MGVLLLSDDDQSGPRMSPDVGVLDPVVVIRWRSTTENLDVGARFRRVRCYDGGPLFRTVSIVARSRRTHLRTAEDTLHRRCARVRTGLRLKGLLCRQQGARTVICGTPCSLACTSLSVSRSVGPAREKTIIDLPETARRSRVRTHKRCRSTERTEEQERPTDRTNDRSRGRAESQIGTAGASARPSRSTAEECCERRVAVTAHAHARGDVEASLAGGRLHAPACLHAAH